MPERKKDWWITQHGIWYAEWLREYGTGLMRKRLGTWTERNAYALERTGYYLDQAAKDGS